MVCCGPLCCALYRLLVASMIKMKRQQCRLTGGLVKSFDFQWQESEFADSYTLCQKAVLASNEWVPIS